MRSSHTLSIVLVLLLGCLDHGQGFVIRPFGPHASRNAIFTQQSTLRLPETANPDGLASEAPDSSSPASTGEWTKSRIHNTSAFRSLALLLVLALAGATSKSPVGLLPNHVASSIHLLSFGTWFGTVAYTTFVAGLTMFQNLPRKVFGKLQSKLFPKYFALCSTTLVLQLITIKSLALAAPTRAFRVLSLGLIMTLVNQFYLEPKSTSIMFERYELDDVPGAQGTENYKALKAEFGKLHGISSLTNLLALCTGVAHAVFLASGLAK